MEKVDMKEDDDFWNKYKEDNLDEYQDSYQKKEESNKDIMKHNKEVMEFQKKVWESQGSNPNMNNVFTNISNDILMMSHLNVCDWILKYGTSEQISSTEKWMKLYVIPFCIKFINHHVERIENKTQGGNANGNCKETPKE